MSGPQNRDERRGEDRRSSERRVPRWRFDPLFAATLVNQITPTEPTTPGAYKLPARGPGKAIFINLKI